MSTIRGQGRPTRKTAGGVGDIYIDTASGVRYKCTNAYGVNGEYDYQWKVEKAFGKKEEPVKETKVEEVKPAVKESQPAVQEEKVEPDKKPAEEVKPAPKKNKTQKKAEKPVETTEATPQRTNYAAAYKAKTEQ